MIIIEENVMSKYQVNIITVDALLSWIESDQIAIPEIQGLLFGNLLKLEI